MKVKQRPHEWKTHKLHPTTQLSTTYDAIINLTNLKKKGAKGKLSKLFLCNYYMLTMCFTF